MSQGPTRSIPISRDSEFLTSSHNSVPSTLAVKTFADTKLAISATSSMSVLSSSFASSTLSSSFSQTSVSSSFSQNSLLLNGTSSFFFAKTGSNTFIGSQTVTGSLYTSGSNSLVGDTILSGNLVISGSRGRSDESIRIYGDVEHSGHVKFLPVPTTIDPSISASYIYVSGSSDDLYFSQNAHGRSNTVRLRWLESDLYTGILHGGIISSSVGGTTFSVSSGSGIVVQLNASTQLEPDPTIVYLNWSDFLNQPLIYSGSASVTYIGISGSGELIQQSYAWGSLTTHQWETDIHLGEVFHFASSVVNGFFNNQQTSYGASIQVNDFVRAFGPMKIAGNVIQTSGSTLGIRKSAGQSYLVGANYVNEPNHPSTTEDIALNTCKLHRYYKSGSVFIVDSGVANNGYPVLDVTKYVDTTTGNLTTVNVARYSIQRVYWAPVDSGVFTVYYGNATYKSIAEAEASARLEPFSEAPNTQLGTIYLGFIIVKGNATSLESEDALIVQGGLFRQVTGISATGGTSLVIDLDSLSDVSASNLAAGDFLKYNGTSWTNSKTLSGSYYRFTGSYEFSAVGGGLTGSLLGTAKSASYALNAPNFATGSSHNITSSWAVSSSYSVSASYISSSGVSGTVVSASYALNAPNFATGSSHNITSSWATSSSFAVSASAYLPLTGGDISGSLTLTSSGLLRFGGATNAFPALKRNGTYLQVRFADDSDYTSVEMGPYLFMKGALNQYYNEGAAYFRSAGNAVFIANPSSLQVNASIDLGSVGYNSANCSIVSEGAGLIAFRNGDNTSTFNSHSLLVYGDYTSSANYVRAALLCEPSVVRLSAQTGGTGRDDIDIVLSAAGTGSVRSLSTISASTFLGTTFQGTSSFSVSSSNSTYSTSGSYSLNSNSAITASYVTSSNVFGLVSSSSFAVSASAYLPLAGGIPMTGQITQNNTAGNVVNIINSSAAGESGTVYQANGVNKYELYNIGSSHFGLYNYTTAQDSFRVVTATDEFRIAGSLVVYGPAVTFTGNPSIAVGTVTSTVAAGYNNMVINGVGEAGIILKHSGTSKWQIYDNTIRLGFYNFTTAAENLTILQSSGNVGIGVTSPISKLDVAGNIVLRDGTNSQTLQVYGTYTDTNNYQRLSLSSGVSSVTLASQTAGTGVDDIDVVLSPAGTGSVKSTATISASTFLGTTFQGTSSFSVSSSNALSSLSASYAPSSPSVSASYASTSSWSQFAGTLLGSVTSASYALSSSYSTDSNSAITASYITSSNVFGLVSSSSFAVSASAYLPLAGGSPTGNIFSSAQIRGTTFLANAFNSYDNGYSLFVIDSGDGKVHMYGNGASLLHLESNNIEQRNGTTAQSFRIYGSYTDSSNYVRANLSCSAVSATLAAQTSGSGTNGANLYLSAAGTGSVVVSGSKITLGTGGSGTTVNFGTENAGPYIYIGGGGATLDLKDQYGRTVFGLGNYPIVASHGGLDILLTPEAGAYVEQRNSTNAQTLRVYGTYTDSNNYVRAALSSSSTSIGLAAETAGTGADDIDLILSPAGAGFVRPGTIKSGDFFVKNATYAGGVRAESCTGGSGVALTISDYSDVSKYKFFVDNSGVFGVQTNDDTTTMRINTQGVLSVQRVIATSPEYSFAPGFTLDSTNGSESGIFMPAASTVGFCTARTERMRIDVSGKVGIGSAAPNAQLQVSCSASVTVGSIIKGAASQTANLQEWQNSAGTVLASVNSIGGLTGSLFGSSSYALSASYAPGSPSVSASYASTSSWSQFAGTLLGSVTSASYATTSSYISTVLSAGNDRLLTSNGSVSGSNAESNFTFDGTTAVVSGSIVASRASASLEVFRVESRTPVGSSGSINERTYQFRVATTGSEVVPVYICQVPAETVMGFDITTVSRRTGSPVMSGSAEDGGFFKIISQYNNIGGVATIVGSDVSVYAQSNQGTWAIATASDGADGVLMNVTGAEVNDITWHATVKTYSVVF